MGFSKLVLNTIPRRLLIKISLWLRPFLILFYKGNHYTDPIDGKTYRKFLPYGYQSQRKNVLAPGSLSLERHRLLWLYLKNDTNFFTEPKKVLHLAPEQAFHSRFKKQNNLDYITADLDSPLADLKADIMDLPFVDETFDVVICNHVLEHVADDKKAMQELYRVLRKGGLGIFQVPQDLNRESTYEDANITDPKERTKHFGQYDHVRVYGKDYFDRLRTVGFNVTPIDYSTKISPHLFDRYRLAKGELLPVCVK